MLGHRSRANAIVPFNLATSVEHVAYQHNFAPCPTVLAKLKGTIRPRLVRRPVRPRGAGGGAEIKWVQHSFFIFSALSGQNARKLAGKTHMVWAHLTRRGDPRAYFFILTPPFIYILFRVLHIQTTKTIDFRFLRCPERLSAVRGGGSPWGSNPERSLHGLGHF